ncbi:MAG: protein kinase [Polyangiaceae bacterium]
MEQRFGEYLVKRMLGEGGMGKVYEGEERLSGRRVALKVLRSELARNEDGRRLFLSEMQILAHLEHPAVVRSLASFEHEGQLVLVLEYLEGKTLRDELLQRGRLSWSEAVEIACRIAEALDAAHRQEPPIVHRDLKPENVMILPTGGLKVMDFGIAKVLAAAQHTNTQSLGTLQYMSPEQIDAKPVDGRTDLYALGLVLYEMIAGRAPFQSSSPRELLNLQCTAEPPALPDDVRRTVPRGVDAVWRALLANRPEDRPPSAREVLDRLAPFRTEGDGPLVAAAPAATNESKGPSTERLPGAPPVPTVNASAGSDARPASTKTEAAAAPPLAGEKPAPPRADTIALLERNTAAKDISTPKALLFIVGISLFAGVATYLARSHAGAGSPEPARSAELPTTPR